MEFKQLSKIDNALLLRVDEVLHYLWDPISICEIPEARDEYSSYAGVVLSMLKRGEPSERISAYLRGIRVDHMGMGTPEQGNEDEIAAIVTNWKENLFGEE
jgi:hypothetical protein